MNKLDTFNSDKFKCGRCKQYLDKKEFNRDCEEVRCKQYLDKKEFNRDCEEVENWCFDCCKKFIFEKIEKILNRGYKHRQVENWCFDCCEKFIFEKFKSRL